jgi:hypothetical protein
MTRTSEDSRRVAAGRNRRGRGEVIGMWRRVGPFLVAVLVLVLAAPASHAEESPATLPAEAPPAGSAPAPLSPSPAAEAPAEEEKEAEEADEAEETEATDEAEEAEEDESAAAEPAEPPEPRVDPIPWCPPPPPPCWKGSVEVRVRGRWAEQDGSRDLDLYEYLRLRYRDERAVGWSFSLFGRLSQDLDGEVDTDEFFVFDSVDDTGDSWFSGRLYHAYANWRPGRGVVEEVRIGRQYQDAGEYLHFDGVRATIDPGADRRSFRLHGFVGVPAHLYESSPEGDFVGGAGVFAEPIPCAEARLDYAFLRDENRWYGTEEAHLVTASWFQRIRTYTSVRATYQQVNEDPRTFHAAIDSWIPRPDVTWRGSFRTQLSEEQALVFDLDPYFAIARDLEPYWEAHAAVSKGFGSCFTAEVGGAVRRLYDPDDAGDFNREFERVYATLATWRWPHRTLGLSVTGEWWESREEDVGAVSFEATWQPSRRWRVRAGTDYALYRTDLYTASERLDSRGVFAKAEFRPNPRWRVHAGVRWEDDDFDTYWTLDAGVRMDF